MDHSFAPLAKLSAEHGDAFYLVHPEQFRANLRGLLGSFRAVYPRTRLAYSYKTNYMPLLCRIANEEGCYPEVVSRMEYDLALNLGASAKRIIFNGPVKSEDDLEVALTAGALVNVDSLAEVESIETISRRRPEARLRVGLRCYISLGPDHRSRFGLEGEELAEAHDRLRRLPSCSLEALHCHASLWRDSAAYGRRADALVSLARTFFPEAAPAYLDVGGGLFGDLPEDMRPQFADDVPSWDEVADAVGSVFAAAFPGPDGPTLVLEPGASVVADAVEFVCRVVALKRLGTRNVAVVTGSIQNIKARDNPIRLPLTVVRDPDRSGVPMSGPIDVTGYTCLEADYLVRDLDDDLDIGDFLVFSHVGAYTNVFKPPFIRPAPAMLVADGSGHVLSVPRRAETIEDIFATYDSRR